jgi:hypothetical protein
MRLSRVALLFVVLTLSAQTPDLVDVAWNDMATAGNAWRTQHSGMLWSKADHERFRKFEAESRRFFQLAKEAKL